MTRIEKMILLLHYRMCTIELNVKDKKQLSVVRKLQKEFEIEANRYGVIMPKGGDKL